MHAVPCPHGVYLPSHNVIIFMQVIEDMRKSIFCLVLPGDSASARRTTEIFMSGCIPVFLGPPYGSMPFAKAVDYRGSSYVANVTQYGCEILSCALLHNTDVFRIACLRAWMWRWCSQSKPALWHASVQSAAILADQCSSICSFTR